MTGPLTKEQLLVNLEKRLAIVNQIEIIGEACDRISELIKDAHTEIP